MQNLNNYYLINKIVKKEEYKVKMILYLKLRAPRSYLFYTFLILLHFLGLLIVSNHFIKDTNVHSESIKLSDVLRNLTSFQFFKNISQDAYMIISIIICLLLIVYYILIVIFYRNIKYNESFLTEDNNINLRLPLEIMSVLFLVLAQHFKEILSFIFIMFIVENPNSDYILFRLKNNNYIILIINALSIIGLNIFQFFCLKILNEPIFNSGSPLCFKLTNSSIIGFVIISNFQCVQYIDSIIESNLLMIVLDVIAFVVIVGLYLNRFKIFNFKNINLFVIEFLYTFSFFSLILEIIFYITSQNDSSNGKMVFLIFIKVALSLSFMIANYFIKDNYFLNSCKDVLFKEYFNQTYNQSELEIFYYFQNLIYSFRIYKEQKDLNKIINIILSHKLECSLDICNCKLISSKYHKSDQLLENIFNSLNFLRDKNVNIIFSEYLLLMRKTPIFSYGLINTFKNRNIKILSTFDKSAVYNLIFRTIINYNDKFCTKIKDYVMFDNIFKNIHMQKQFNKKLELICKDYDFFINFKERFDNCLKLEETCVDSYILEEIDDIVKVCNNFKNSYKKIKSDIKKYFEKSKCEDIELSYKLRHFFNTFNKKIPHSINRLLLNQTDDNYIKIKEVYDNNNHFQIIFEINYIFKIRYFNYKLASVLGYNHSSLIGEDIHILFPTQLKENHKKVILKYLLIENNFRLVKKTFAFTSYNSILPVLVKASSFPTFSKNLSFIIDIEALNESEQKVFYFILSEEFNTISINPNLEKFYKINFQLLNKVNADILKLFDISHEFVTSRLKARLQYLHTLKDIKRFFGIYYNIFNLNLAVDQEAFQAIKAPPTNKTKNIKGNDETGSVSTNSRLALKDQNKTTNSTQQPLNSTPSTSPVKNLNKIETENDAKKSATASSQLKCIIKVDKDKNIFINNLEIYKTRYLDYDLNINDFHKLEECINQLKENEFTHYSIKIHLRNYIDTPFYIIRVSETTKKAINFEKNYTTLNSTRKSKIADSIKLVMDVEGIIEDPNESIKTSNRESTPGNNDSGNLVDEVYNYLEKMREENPNDSKDSTNKKEEDKPELTKKKKIEKKNHIINPNKEKNSMIAIICMILLVIGGRIYIFQFKNESINTLLSIFELNYWNNLQKSSLNFLHSSILTLTFQLSGLTTFRHDEPVKEIQSLITQRSLDHKNYFIKFYEKLISLKDENVISKIFEVQGYGKTLLNWEEVIYNSTFYDESKFIHKDISLLTYDSNLSSLTIDLKKSLIFENFKKKRVDSQVSSYGTMIHYLNSNIPNIFIKTINSIEDYLKSFSVDYYNNSKNRILILEIVCLVISIALVILIVYLLYEYDKSFFGAIIHLFINPENSLDSSYKTPAENLQFREKIKFLRNLLINIQFTEEKKNQTNDNKDTIISKWIEELKNEKKLPNDIDLDPKTTYTKLRALMKKKKRNSIFIKNHGELEDDDVEDKKKPKKKKVEQTNNENLITNELVINNTKHYQTKFIRIAKFLVLIIFLTLVSLSIANIITSISDYEVFHKTKLITDSLISRFSVICQLFNYVRLTVFNKTPNLSYSADSYEKLLSEIQTISDRYTEFLNQYSERLDSTWTYGRSIDNNLDENNKNYLCGTNTDLCRLNIKGIDSGIESTIHTIKVIYRDFLMKNSNPTLEEIIGYFTTDIFLLINFENDYIFRANNVEFTERIYDDMYKIYKMIQNLIILLGMISLFCNLIIVFYLIFGFLSMLRNYLNIITYSCNKLNNALYK